MIETSIAQVRSAKLVALAGFGVGGLMVVTGTYFVGMQEARAFMGMGLALVLVSACWAVLLGLRAIRSSGKIESWFGYLLGGMAALLTFIFGLCVMRVFPWDFLYLTSATLLSALFIQMSTLRHVARQENLSRTTWSPTQRLQAGQARLRKLTLLSIFCFILPVWFVVCAQLTTPSWHVTLMQRLPQPLRTATYSTVASFSMQQELIKADSIPDETLEREIRSELPDFFRILSFESLTRRNPSLAFSLSAEALRTDWPRDLRCMIPSVETVSKSPMYPFGRYYNEYSVQDHMIAYYVKHANPTQIREVARDPKITSRYTFLTFAFLLKPEQRDYIDTELTALFETGSYQCLTLALALLSSHPTGHDLQRCTHIWNTKNELVLQQFTAMLANPYMGTEAEWLFNAGLTHSRVETRRTVLAALLFGTQQSGSTFVFPGAPFRFNALIMKRLEDPDLKVRRLAAHIIARSANFTLKHTPLTRGDQAEPDDSQDERDEIKAMLEQMNQVQQNLYKCKGGGTRTYGTRGGK